MLQPGVALVWSVSTFSVVPDKVKERDVNFAYNLLIDEGWLIPIYSDDSIDLFRWKLGAGRPPARQTTPQP